MAGGRGFEPRLTDPESAVLPLDDPPLRHALYHNSAGKAKIEPIAIDSMGEFS